MQRSDRRIALVCTNKHRYSETFIDAQLEKLPFSVFYLHTGYLPTLHGDDDQPILDRPESSFPSWEEHRDALTRAMRDFLREHRIELVLAQYGPSGTEMMGICRDLGIPLIVYFRGYDAYRDEVLQNQGRRYPELFEIASALFVVSHAMQKQLEALGAPGEKIHYNPSGANTEKFHYQEAGANPVVFLATGRFEASKSPHLTVLAFAEVVKRVPEARLIMGGEGHLLESCMILAQALKVAHAIEFRGVLKHEQVARLMAGSRAFVQHSITTPSNDREGTPTAICEAGASGLPVVATRHAGIPEVVDDGETGFLVEEGDIEGMARCMIRLARDPELATRLGRAAHAKIVADFTTERNIQRLAAVIDRLIGR